jgi:predicted site-specific integrase-resolvase
MAPLDDYLSDSESARICGVSINTLNRFIETGYLKVEHDHDGLRLFSKDQLKRVFGVGESAFSKQTRINRPIAGNAAIKIDEVKISVPKEQVSSETAPATEPQPEKPTHLKIVRADEQEASPTSESLTSASSIPLESLETKPMAAQSAPLQAPQPQEIVATQYNPALIEKISSLESDNQVLEMERTKLQNVITLLEKMLEIRESEIDSLKRQQQWLETRVEKMEERSHREQLLLLAESETVRKLVVMQKRSPVRAALEWLGLAESTEPRNHIEADRN